MQAAAGNGRGELLSHDVARGDAGGVAGPESSGSAGRAMVGLLCPEPRLRRIVRLVLLADEYDVADVTDAGGSPDPTVAAVVADLDGLRCDPATALATLEARGVRDDVPVLLISVYSPDLGFPERAGPLEYLQPPFGLPELTVRLERLIGSRSPARQDDSGPVRCARAAGRPGIGGSEAD